MELCGRKTSSFQKTLSNQNYVYLTMTIASTISSLRSIGTERSSDASSLGSRTFDSPRKRRDFPKKTKLPNNNPRGGNPSMASSISSSNQSPLTRPPLSSHSTVEKRTTRSSQASLPLPSASPRRVKEKESSSVQSAPAVSSWLPPPARRPPRSPHKTTGNASAPSTPSNKKTVESSSPKEGFRSESPASLKSFSQPTTRSSSPSPITRNKVPNTISEFQLDEPEEIPPQIETIPPVRAHIMMSSKSSVVSKSSAVSRTSSITEESKHHHDVATSNGGITPFHVRVSMGYMTGINAEQTKKKKRNSQSHSLLVGYALIEKNGKQIASSQPVIPKYGAKESSPVKIVWASPKVVNEDVRSSKLKRRLNFSVQLGKESDVDSGNDDNLMVDPTDPFEPEVVKLEIGLKCGDVKHPLGIGNLVISGKEIRDQKVTLAVRPFHEAKSSNQRSRRSIFGSGKKQHVSSFIHNGYIYKLDSNATLRVRVDVKAGKSNQSSASAWISDEASFATYWSYDGTMASALSKSSLQQINQEQSALPAYVESRTSQNRLLRPPPFQRQELVEKWSKPAARPVPSNLSGKYPARINTRSRSRIQDPNFKPMEFVVVHESDMQSVASGLTVNETNFFDSFLIQMCTPFGFCGEDFESHGNSNHRHRGQMRHKGALIQNYSVESNADVLSDSDGNKKAHSLFVALPDLILSDDSGSSESEDVKHSSKNKNVGTHVTNGLIADKKKSKHANDRREKKHQYTASSLLKADSLDGESVEISVGTYTDLKTAHSTLQRYASKVGIQMEDLLERGDPKRSQLEPKKPKT